MFTDTRWMGRLGLGLWCGLLLLVSGTARSQSTTPVTPDQEYIQLIKVNQDIEPLGANPFGENISPYNGELSFEETDVSLKGNGPAIVVARSLSTTSPLSYSFDAERPFGDWDLNIPRIETVTAAQGNYQGWITSGLSAGTRCSNFSAPPAVAPLQPGGDDWLADQWWYGYHLIVPGVGSQDLMPRSTNNSLAPAAGTSAYAIVTKNNWMITCTAANAASDGGQGFIAVAPDGTQYTFTHLVYRPMTNLSEPLGTAPEVVKAASSGIQPLVADTNLIERNDAFMYVTQVVDRFGNSLTYNYNNANGNLTSITASDGRSVTINYDSTGFMITSITANASNVPSRTWTYAYSTSNPDLPTLTSVTLPDGSAWGYNLGSFQIMNMQTEGGDCTGNHVATLESTTPYTGTITHPSGLMATFSLQAQMHGRSYVPKSCWGPASSGTDLTYYQYPEYYFQPTIISKTFTGAGIPTETWTYNYSAANQSYAGDACYAAGTCLSTIYTDVTDPNGNDIRYTYSNRWNNTEGQLLTTTYYNGAAGGAVLRTETNTYANPTGGPWPAQYGLDLQDRNNTSQTTELAPLQTRTTVEEGDTYTWAALGYDTYADPTDVKRYNSIGGQQPIEETSTYLNDPNLWVLGLLQTVTNVGTGEVESSNVYNSQDLLQSRARFGELLMSYTYNGAGQLASFTDGDSNTTTISDYYRGIPQQINYPDNGQELLTVDDLGQISSITDQNNNVTQYSYDPIGRITQITYPTNDSVSWYPKTFSYTYVNSAERGIAAGHWDRVTTVGSDVTTTYFDTKLRPILSDTSNGSQDITTATTYDYTGATTFAAYPVYGQPAISGLTLGTHHTYDALERETLTQEDSELAAPSTTTTAYIAGAGKQVTDPNHNVTTTYYQVFDEPDYKDPGSVSAPDGITQLIARDIYGNPKSITQSGAYGSENDSVTKTLTYDGYHRLCATSEPESGTTLMGYDGANNLAWSLQGQPLGSACAGAAPTNATVRTYDPMNRVLTITPPAGTQATTYQYDLAGNLVYVTSQTNGTGGTVQEFTYDTRNLLTTEALSVPGYAWAMGYSYDSYGHLSAIGYPSYNSSSEGVAYNPDALGRATQVGGYASGISYFPNSQVAGFTYGSGASYAAQQNTRQLLSNFSDGLGGSAAINEGYTYDANGNITMVADNLPNGTRGKTFTYDALNRLTGATASGLYGAESYTYDALNNLRTRVTGGNTLTLNYNASNQLASVSEGASTTTVYGYDNQGNRNSLSSGGATTNYSFDVENQLLNVSNVESYLYDAAGRRVAKTNASGAVTAYYMYDQAGQLMYEFDPASATGTNYIYLGTKLIAKDAMQQVAVPTGVTISPSNPNSGSFTVSWNAVPDATSYTLQTTNGAGSATVVYSGSATTTAQTLTKGGEQFYQLNACSSAGCSGWFEFAVDVWPAIPTFGPLPTGTDNGGYTVSWSAPAGANTYDVQVSTDGGTTWTALATGTTSNSIAQPGDVTGSYTYRVQAHNRQVTGTAGWAVSPVVTVNTNYGVAPTPTPTLTVPATSYTGNATISWTAASPVTSYTLQQSSNGGSTWTTVPNLGTDTASVTGLAAGNYVYQLQACNTAGGGNACTSWVSGGPMVVTLPPSPAPTVSAPSESYNGTYIVDWSGNNEATSYTVQRSTNGGSTWTTGPTGTGTAYDATGEGNGTYTYEVEACNVAGCSAWSAPKAVVVLLPPGAPSLSGGGTSTSGSYSMSWNAVATATSYTLQESANGGGWTNVQSNSSATSWSTSGRANGSYRYQVQGCNATCGPFSNIVTETVALIPAPPAYVTAPTSVPYPGNAWSVAWASVSGATSYTLQRTNTSTGAVVAVYSGSATTRTDYVIPGTYTYQVQACNASGCSAWQNSQVMTVFCSETEEAAETNGVQPLILKCD